MYRLLPAANPGSAAHVLVLVSSPGRDLAAAFPSDSALEAQRLVPDWVFIKDSLLPRIEKQLHPDAG